MFSEVSVQLSTGRGVCPVLVLPRAGGGGGFHSVQVLPEGRGQVCPVLGIA